MRSNSLDFSSFETMNVPDTQKKTERSHEENQERAYIAASRRTDRSLEARVQSARMASEIHKRRTGKSFRISEEIVVKEEMYEEEDDDLPRSYRVLGPNMQTASPDMNYRVEAYLSNKVAMSAMLARTNDEWRQNEVNRMFAQMFPQHASSNPQGRASHSPVLQPQPQPQQQQPPMPEQFQQMQPTPEQFAASQQFYSQPQNTHHNQHARALSTSAIPQSQPQHPDFYRHDSGIGMPTSPSNFDKSQLCFDQSPQPDSPIDLGASRSAFTSELPTEARMMMDGVGMERGGNDATLQSWPGMDASFDMSGVPRGAKGDDDQMISPMSGHFDMTNMKWDQMMPPVDDSTWNTFINDSAWANDQ